MRRIWLARLMFAAACTAISLGCQAGSPASPSHVAGLAVSGMRPLADEGDPPAPPPAGTPNPDLPAPGMPATQTITIVGTSGFGAYDPNPSKAALGDLIVWTNMDANPHHIVLDDGTDVGVIAPGAASTPMPLATAVAGYHCTFHPSMTGTINGEMPPPPPPEEEPPPYVYRK